MERATVYLPDVRLIRRLRAGEREALQHYLTEQAALLHVFFGRLVSDATRAEARLHETLTELARDATRFDDRRGLTAQTFAVALRHLDPPRPDDGQRPEADRARWVPWWRRPRAAPTDGEADPVVAAVDALPTRLRLPLLLSTLAGLTADEVGDVLGIAPAEARHLEHRARIAVAARLSKEPAAGGGAGAGAIAS